MPMMREVAIDGEDWVLIDWSTKNCVVAQDSKKPITFNSKADAEKFKVVYGGGALSAFEPAQVKQLTTN